MMAQPREGYSNTGTPKETEHQCSPNTPTAPAQAETSRKAAVQGHTCNGRKTLPAKSKTSSPEKNGPKPTRHYDQTAATERTTSTADTGQNGSPSSKSRKRRLAGCGPAEYAITSSCLQNGASSSKQPPITHTTTTRIKNMIEFTFEQVETVAEARWELEIMRYPEHAQHMIRTWQKLGDQGKSEIRQEAQYILEALDLHALLAQAWQDGHDTALLNGQTKNPHNQEPR